MLGRGVWFAAGAAAGVYGMIRARRVAEAFTADGLRDRVGAVVLGARMFGAEVAQGAVEAETELRERYEVAAAAHRARALTAPVRADHPEPPALLAREGHPADVNHRPQEGTT